MTDRIPKPEARQHPTIEEVRLVPDEGSGFFFGCSERDHLRDQMIFAGWAIRAAGASVQAAMRRQAAILRERRK